jgi:hypothetical protein
VKVVVSSWFNASTTFGCGCGGGGFVLASGRGDRGAYVDDLSTYFKAFHQWKRNN